MSFVKPTEIASKFSKSHHVFSRPEASFCSGHREPARRKCCDCSICVYNTIFVYNFIFNSLMYYIHYHFVFSNEFLIFLIDFGWGRNLLRNFQTQKKIRVEHIFIRLNFGPPVNILATASHAMHINNPPIHPFFICPRFLQSHRSCGRQRDRRLLLPAER